MANANRITVSPSELVTLLRAAITSPNPLRVLIAGSPGLGKTSMVNQAAEVEGADTEVFKAGVHEPPDVTGLLPYGFLLRVREYASGAKGKRLVLFLDDMGQGTSGMNAALMKFVDDYKSNPNIVIIAATNKRTDRSGVNTMFEALKSRFHTIVELQTNLRDWIKWAAKGGIDSRVLSYLSFRPDHLHHFEPKEIGDLDNFPCPRTWEQASDLIKIDLPRALRTAALSGAVGNAVATEFDGFLRVADDLPDIDAVVANPNAAPSPEKMEVSALWALAGALADRANKDNLGRVLRYCERMHESKKGEFAALTLNLTLQRKPELISANNPHWTKAMAGPLGDLLIGSSAK
jgi:hypothetical protein